MAAGLGAPEVRGRRGRQRPWVWAPLAGAALFQIDDWDRRVSDWAREHTPVFGSEADADEWSDDLRDASVLANWATMIATPGGSDPQRWILAKTRGALVDAAAVASTVAVTRGIKTTVERRRPNGLESESFPRVTRRARLCTRAWHRATCAGSQCVRPCAGRSMSA